MKKDDLDGLIVLKLVADRRSFVKAASSLGITPSAVSQIVKQLELRFGVTLLNRNTRNVGLTEAGEKFLEQVGPSIEQISIAIDGMGAVNEKPSGVLRIALPKLAFFSYLKPIAAKFQKLYPEITLDLYLDDSENDLVSEGFDAGIRVSDILAKDMIAIKLFGPLKYVTVASPNYLSSAGRPKHPKYLLNYNCLIGRLKDSVYDRWEFEQRGKEFSVKVKGNFVINDSMALLEAASAGFGISYMEESSVKDRIKKKELEVVLESFAAKSDGYYLYFPRHARNQPKLRAFIEFIKESNLKDKLPL